MPGGPVVAGQGEETGVTMAPPGDAGRREQVMAIVGLTALLVSLLTYSASVTPFVAHPGYSSFMKVFAPCMLGSAALVSVVCARFAFMGRQLPQRVLEIAGSACFLAGSVTFAFLALTPTTSLLVVLPLALITGTGDVALCLIWGRICRRFTLRQVLSSISAAGILSAGALWGLTQLGQLTVSIAFSLCAVLAVALSLYLARATGTAHAGAVHETDARPPSAPQQILPSLVDVIAMPMLGLIFFAYVVGVLRMAIVASFNHYLLATAVASVVLLAYVFFQRRPLNLRSMHLTFISFFSVVLLTVSSLSAYLGLDQGITIFVAYLLYIMAAILTLSSLAAIARAAEFVPDLIFSLAVFLFCTSSVAGLLSGMLIADDAANVVMIIATTAYAFVAVLFSHFRSRRLVEWSETEGARPGTRQVIAEACARIAREHQLTTREEEILRYLAEGHNGVFISEVLSISPNTVRTHIHNIYRKLDVSSREDILRLTRD